MDFLKNLALPQSHEHLILLKYLLGLTFTLFLPYLSLLIGASFLSIILKKKSTKENDGKYIRYARDLINIVTFNRSVVYALGIVPLLSTLFCYLQLLQNSSSSVLTLVLLSSASFIIGIILIYSYKHSFNLKTIFEYVQTKQISFEEPDTKETFESYGNDARHKFEKTDLWSLIFFSLAAFLFIGAISQASNSELWGSDYSIIASLFSVKSLSYLIYFFILSVAVTLIAGLFYTYKYKQDEKADSEYVSFVREYSINLSLVLTIILPVFVLFTMFFTPPGSLAYFGFISILLMLISLLLIATLLYVMMKDSKVNYVTTLVVLVIFVFIFSNAKDQIAFSTASKQHLAGLEAEFIKYEEDFKASLGLSTVTISGEDIYNGKCIACHQFDKVLVGPPYKEILPKYDGDKEGLVQFILNPVKVDPNYPAMPNQGLKPNEAKAVAEYILETYK